MAFITAAIITGGTAALAGGAGLVGAHMQSQAAGEAADKQLQASREATALQEKMYNQSRTDNEPWRQAGMGALSQLGDQDFQRDFTADDFQKDPGYDFRMQEGQKALERSAAARGGLQSGGMMKALSRYGQGFASNEYNNAYNRFNSDRDRRFNRLSSLAGIGQTATNQNAAAGHGYANQVGQNTMGAANAAGAAGVGSATAWSNGATGVANAANGAANNWMTMSMMNKMYPGSK